MERKGGITAVVTAEEIRAAVGRGRFDVCEDRALRMRYGATVDPRAPLPRAAGGNAELEDELLLLEVRLLRALKRRQASSAAGAPSATPARGEASPAKKKIVAALRTRKRS